jgi:Flp pilus assembly protein TadG
MEPHTAAPRAAPAGSAHRRGRSGQHATTAGQAVAEFSVISVAFFLMVFGAIDFGRALYAYAQLRDAVGAGAQYGVLHPADADAITNAVIVAGDGLRISPADVIVTCAGGCGEDATDVTVSARARFTAISQDLIGLSPLTLTASATVASK